MNIIDITSADFRNKGTVLGLQPQAISCEHAKEMQRQQVKIDVKKILVLQNKLTTTTI